MDFKDQRWYKLIRNTIIGAGVFAAVAGTWTIIDHNKHDEERHVEKIKKHNPPVYHEAKIVTKGGDTITVYIPVDGSSKGQISTWP